jgi:cation:H+ antiporter
MFEIFLFLASIAILAKGASWFSDSSVKLSLLLRVPQVLVGATVVAIATTAPEAVVSIFSSLTGHSGLALGNVLGSPVVNIGLAFSFLLLFSQVTFNRRLLYHIVILIISIFFLEVILFFRRPADVLVAFPLLLFALSFLAYEFFQMRKSLDYYFEEFLEAKDVISVLEKFGHFFKLLFFFSVGFGLILIGGTILVQTGAKLAKLLGVGELFIGLTFFAIGTSLPEIVLAATTIWKKTARISSGNLFGASILTLTWVLGTAALFGKIDVSDRVFLFDLPAILVFALITLLGFLNKIPKKVLGLFLLVCYIFYIVLLKNL